MAEIATCTMYLYIVQVEIDVVPLVERLRREGSDRADVEAKAAAGGLPRSPASTLSAFASMPGGGLVVLGLDEKAGFTATGLDRPSVLLERLAAMARQALVADAEVLQRTGVTTREADELSVAGLLAMGA